jgi:hypothetical protein
LHDCTDFKGIPGEGVCRQKKERRGEMTRDRRLLERIRPNRSDRYFPGADVIVELLDKVEGLQERLWLLNRHLTEFLATGLDPDDEDADPIDVARLQRGWHAFIRAGGVTAGDLHAFLRGDPIGPDTRVKRHLRLVRSNKRPLRRTRAVNGHDAA